MPKSEGKVLLLTQALPPVVGGTSILLYELLKFFPEDSMIGIYGTNDPPVTNKLKVPFLIRQILFMNSHRWTLRAYRYRPDIMIRLIMFVASRIIRKNNITRIYAHYPNGTYTVAAYKLARKHKLPLTVYFDILWEERASGKELELSKEYEKAVIEYADQRFAITEFAVDHLTEKHRKSFELIPHTIDSGLATPYHEAIGSINIHFAGGIYPQMNEDSVIRLANVIQEIIEEEKMEITFEVCSPDLPASIKDYPFIKWRFLSKEELLDTQRKSSILFLPQSFESSTPLMIKNNMPTKTMEYLCSGRPILVHSPADSYLSHLATQHGFAEVVDAPDQEKLKNALLKLIRNSAHQKILVEKGITFLLTRDARHWSDYLREKLFS
jgi:glycosyltransferase involved in cell wall biosynthesis